LPIGGAVLLLGDKTSAPLSPEDGWNCAVEENPLYPIKWNFLCQPLNSYFHPSTFTYWVNVTPA